jgi:hypothetical protein
VNLGGECEIEFDAYYLLSGILVVVGIAWFLLMYKMVKRIGRREKNDWKLTID